MYFFFLLTSLLYCPEHIALIDQNEMNRLLDQLRAADMVRRYEEQVVYRRVVEERVNNRLYHISRHVKKTKRCNNLCSNGRSE